MPGTTKRVLIVGKGEPETGGIASYMRMLVGSLDRTRFDPDFLNLARADASGVGIWTVSNIMRSVVDLWRVFRRARGCDVVHIHTAFAPSSTAVRAVSLALAARTRRATTVVHVHGGRVPGWLTSRSGRILGRLAAMPVHHIVAVSAAAAAALSELTSSEVTYVRNGVDLDTFRMRSERRNAVEPTVGFVGAFLPEKGIRELLSASCQLADQGIRHRLVVVGRGSLDWLDPGLHQDVTARSHIDVIGELSHGEMPSFYTTIDVLCLPSWSEASPLVVTEAMAAGVAVVATDVGDVGTTVTSGVTGLVIPPRELEPLVEALASLLVDRDRTEAMGAAGREFAVVNLDWALTVGAVEAIYSRSG